MPYKINLTEEGDVIDCFHCQSAVPTEKLTYKIEFRDVTEFLCRYCANSTTVMCISDVRKAMSQMFNELEAALSEKICK